MRYFLSFLIAFSCLKAEGEEERDALGYFYFYPQETLLSPSFRAYPGFSQAVIWFRDDGSGFEMADGSRFSVAWVDQDAIRGWKTDDVIVFFPCQEWFSFFDLKAVNLTYGNEVKVKLDEGPLLSSMLLKTIAAIDVYTCSVGLSDGSIWRIWAGDQKRLSEWVVGDVVLVGCNQSANGDSIIYNVSAPDAYRKYSFATFMGY